MVEDQNNPQAEPRPKPNRPIRIIIGIILLLLFGGSFWLFWLINSPVTGRGTSVTGLVSSKLPAPATPKLLTLSGKHFSFNYPAVFSPMKLDSPITPILENYLLVKHQLNAWNIAVQIESLPSGNLLDDGSYHFRKVKADVYSEKIVTIAGMSVHEMSNKTSSSFSTVAFFTHNGLMASLSLSGGNINDKEAMQSIMGNILSSWKWL